MKKFLSIILVISCVCLICSCNTKKNNQDSNGGDLLVGVPAFEAAIANTNAKNVKVDSVTESDLGTLTSSLKVSYKEDGSAVIEYSFEKFNLIGEGAEDDLKTTYTGTINRSADGSYTGDMIEGLDLSSVSAGKALNLTPIKDDVTINSASDVLKATVSAADTAAVFGSAFPEDVELELSIKDKAVKQIKITFESGSVTYQYD